MKRIGVGIVGLSASGGWAARAHLPALRALGDCFDLVGLCASSPYAAAASAAKYDVPFHTSHPAALARHPGVDLVLIAVKVPDHAPLVSAAIEAGKMVYCEWPLARDLAEASDLAALADASGVRTFIGLQGRAAPAIRYLRDLLGKGYCGEILSVNLLAAVGMPWDGTTDSRRAYLNDRASGGSMLSIPVGHFLDTFTWLFGDFATLASTLAIRRPMVQVGDSGAFLRTDVADQVMLTGTLESGVAASIHYRGGHSPAGNFRWEINGTEGDLVVRGNDGHSQYGLVTIEGAKRPDALTRIAIPGDSESMLAGGAAEAIACAYRTLYQDWKDGSSDSPSFADAVRLHALLARIEAGGR